MKKKCKCGNDKFTLEVMECESCENNGSFDYGTCEWVYTGKTPRSQAFEEGECAMGNSFNFGCWLLTCTKCGEQIHMPLMEG